MYAAVNEKIIIAGDCHVDSRNTQKSLTSALKLSPVPSKDGCCCEGACETQTQTLPESGNRYSWVVNGMDCAACARKVENAVKQVPGVSHVQVLFATEKLLVSADNDVSKQVEDAVSKAGYSLRSEAAPAEKPLH